MNKKMHPCTVLPMEMEVGDIVRPQFGMQGAFIDCVVSSKNEQFIFLKRPYIRQSVHNKLIFIRDHEEYPIEVKSTAHSFTLLSRNR